MLRYGTARELVLGLEVVLPDGRVFDGLRALRKDNTGYDLKQLFIGAEGTLGFITAATCKLYPRPRGVATAMVAVADPEAAIALHSRARLGLGDELIAFELISRTSLSFVLEFLPGAREPLPDPSPWYVLARDRDGARPGCRRGGARELPRGLHRIRAWCETASQHAAAPSGTSSGRSDTTFPTRRKLGGASIKNDISVPVSRVGDFIDEAQQLATTMVPGIRVVAFGHVGDGNIHFNLTQPAGMAPAAFLDLWETTDSRDQCRSRFVSAAASAPSTASGC